MKKILSRCFIIMLILGTLAYGFYIYWINTDHTTSSQESKSQVSNETDIMKDASIEVEVSNNSSYKSKLNPSTATETNQVINLSSKNNEGTNVSSKEKEVKKVKLDLYAQSALLMDATNERILYEKNGLKKMPMASTTKIMTLIVALENSDLNDIVTVSKYASTMPDVQLGIREGEQYKLGDLVYSLMLESHNDTAVAIAEHVGGSVEGFAKMMNQKAKELGCENTNFVTPNGLDADEHYTTAVDLGRIAAYAIKNEKFIEITNTSNYTFSEVNGKRTFNVNNKDAFLTLMDGAMGIKTGFTGKAGYCFVGALERDNKTFISVVLACGWPPNKSYKWRDTKILMNYGLNNYSFRHIRGEKKKLKPISIIDGQSSVVEVEAEEKEIELLLREDESTRVEYCMPDVLVAPIKKHEAVGTVKYYVNDELYDQGIIYTTSSVKLIDFGYCFKQVFKTWGLDY